jgi:6-phosphogluconolactonase (cycloisomerase 2 family)
MKMILVLLVVLPLYVLTHSAFADTWTQVNVSGFGEINNFAVDGAIVFSGYLYVTVRNNSTAVQVWRTAAAGGPPYTDWTQVNTNGFGDFDNLRAGGMAVFKGYLYVGTLNPTTGCQIWRTQASGGPPFTDWTQVNTSGFGSAANTNAHHWAVFNNYLYVGTANADTGTQIWRTGGTGSPPVTWAQVNTGGFGDLHNTDSSAMAVYNSYLYAGTFNPTAGTQIWRTQASGTPPYAWLQVNPSGFGEPHNDTSYTFRGFNGYLYGATHNAVTGTQVGRTAAAEDPPYSDWTQVNASGFGDSNNTDSRAVVFDGCLYVATHNTSVGTQVWRTAGVGNPPFTAPITDWTQVNSDGFGDPNNTFSFLVEFDNNLYAATQNSSTGAQIWQLQLAAATPTIYVADIDDVSVKTWPGKANGDVAPSTLFGSRLKYPQGVAVDEDWIYIANYNGRSVDVYPKNANGDVLPTRSIKGNSTTLFPPLSVAVDGTNIYVATGTEIAVYPKDADGNVAPTRRIWGSNTNILVARGIAIDANWIYVTVHNTSTGISSVLVFPIGATGNVAPTYTIQGANTNLAMPVGIAVDSAWIYVSNWANRSVAIFPVGSNGNVAPARFIQGSNTQLDLPYGISVDTNWIYLASSYYSTGIASVSVFPIGSTGNVSPAHQIAGSETTLASPYGIATDGSFVYVADTGTQTIALFGINDSGNAAPTRVIKGSDTTIGTPQGIAVDSSWVYVLDLYGGISVFPKGTSTDSAPTRLISGSSTTLGFPGGRPFGIAVDSESIYVADAQSRVVVFAKGASGNVTPTRVIQGSNTTLDAPAGIAVDGNWIYVSDGDENSIVVFPKTAVGDVPPSRTIKGSNTTLDTPWGIAVDGNWIFVANPNASSIVVFPKEASGNVAPSRIIQGVNTQVNIPYGIAVDSNWIYTVDVTINVYPIGASGNIAPARVIQGNLTTLQNPIAIAVAKSKTKITDFDGDGKTDVLWQHSSGTVAMWVMNGLTISSVGVPGSVPSDWQVKGIGDFDGDQKADILWYHPASGTVAFWLMNGSTISSVGIPGAISTDWQVKGVGDFNNDGKSDVLWQHTSGTIAIWQMDGMTISSVGVPGSVPSDWQVKGVGDFDGDGKADILWYHPASGTVAFWLMNGSTISSVGIPGSISTDWQVKGVGDFSGDGKSDVLWQHTSGTIAIWQMDGMTISSVGVPGSVPSDWQVKGVGDFDGDGQADILWYHPASGTVAFWLMNGSMISSVGIPGSIPTDWQIKNQ